MKVTIEKTKAKYFVWQEYSIFISSEYFPPLIQKIKSLRYRIWHGDIKKWEIQEKDLPTIEDYLLQNKHELNYVGNFKNKKTSEYKNKLNSKFKYKTKPYKHQEEAVLYGLNHDRFILGDQPGLGKSKVGIDIAVNRKLNKQIKHCLIITGVAGLKWNWKQEVSIHSNESCHILGDRGKKDQSNKDRVEDLRHLPKDFFIATNIEAIRNKDVLEELRKRVEDKSIDMIIFDEFHKAKNPASQQGKALLKLKPKYMIPMTGTLIVNSPLDCFIALKWIGIEHHSYYQFQHHFCIFGGYQNRQVVGYKFLDQLEEQLKPVFLRRLKKDVLDLPKKIYLNEYIEMPDDQMRVYYEIKQDIKNIIDKVLVSPNPLGQLIRLRQATALPTLLTTQEVSSVKLDRVCELVDEITKQGESVVVYSNFEQVILDAYQRLKKYKPSIVTGSQKTNKAEISRFVDDDNCNVICGTTSCLGTGYTLTKAENIIFIDEPWNRANKEQAEDRCHRIGTKGSINIYTLLCKDTIDERIHDIVYSKGQLSDDVLDDGKEIVDKKVIEYLLK